MYEVTAVGVVFTEPVDAVPFPKIVTALSFTVYAVPATNAADEALTVVMLIGLVVPADLNVAPLSVEYS